LGFQIKISPSSGSHQDERRTGCNRLRARVGRRSGWSVPSAHAGLDGARCTDLCNEATRQIQTFGCYLRDGIYRTSSVNGLTPHASVFAQSQETAADSINNVCTQLEPAPAWIGAVAQRTGKQAPLFGCSRAWLTRFCPCAKTAHSGEAGRCLPQQRDSR